MSRKKSLNKHRWSQRFSLPVTTCLWLHDCNRPNTDPLFLKQASIQMESLSLFQSTVYPAVQQK